MPDRPDSFVIHLLRHAHAGDSTTWEGPDEQRPLTKRGRHQAERLGRFLVASGIRPDAIVSSPKIRALQTAELIAQAMDMNVTLDLRLGDVYDLAELERIVRDAEVTAPMLVGHDPDLSFVLSELCAAPTLVMRKGAFATIDVRGPFSPGSGTLRWLVPPDLLPES